MSSGRRPRILLRSSWQVLNIGDVAHTPGVLALLEKYIPEADVILWASADLNDAVIAMEHKRFPGLKVVKGTLDADGHASNPALAEAVAWSECLLHGSGPAMLAYDDVVAYTQSTGKPYGVYGITFGWYDKHDLTVYDRAAFLFFRDSVSLENAKQANVRCPVMAFGPDAAFACDLRDDAAATAFMNANGLQPGRFLCCIPRHRITPYWLPFMNNRPMTDGDRAAHAENEKWKDHDHAPLRQAIERLVDRAGMKVLVCAESADQVALGKEIIYDKLPDRVRANTVWSDRFWMTDEALSTYVRSAGVFGHEMHSPIMCVGRGVPAVVCRWKSQTSKGFMWRDIGLGEWLFDMDDETSIPGIVPAVLGLVENADNARQKVAAARRFVEDKQRETMKIVREKLLKLN